MKNQKSKISPYGRSPEGRKNQKYNSKSGFSLIETIVGTALMLIVFIGIYGVYQLSLKVVYQSRNKIFATAIANQQIEKARNLSYPSVGVKGKFPDGVLDAATTTVRNNVQFTIENRVDYVVDSADGIVSPDDDCPNDYKRAQTRVSWLSGFGGEVILATDISPQNLSQECATGGGILSISVFDAYGKWEVERGSPLIEIKDPGTDQVLTSYTPDDGQHYFSLATSTYKVVVSKSGYSTERTYGTEEIATPEKPHLIVLEGQLTEASFSIDKVSSFSIDILSSWGTDYFADSFSNESKISAKSNTVVMAGEVTLATTTGGYESAGYAISVAISPTNLRQWDKFSFSDSEPENTDLKYQIYYTSSTDWYLIPDGDLPGNSVGFSASPVGLSFLATTTYSQLKLRGNFSTTSTTTTPVLYDWQISWITSQPTPIPNAPFSLRGAKIIGTDANENPVYKYSITTSSDSIGHKNLSGLEWDSYTFSVDPASGLDLIETNPLPQPINLNPDTNLPVVLYLDSANSLLITLQNIVTLEPIFSATVRAFNAGLGYDKIQYTNEKGQTYFIPLEQANYNLEISAPGYAPASTNVWVSGDKTKIIKLEQIE